MPVAFAGKFKAAQRVNRSLTASTERRILEWIAVRAPKWLSADQLTLLGFAAQVAAGIFYACARYDHRALLAVMVSIVLNWFGDSMDGTLARVRKEQRPRYGFYVDHIVDVLGSVALMAGLGVSGYLHWQTAFAMLIAFLLLSSESYLASYSLERFQLSQGIFGPTELRLLLILGTAALLHSPYTSVFGQRMLLFDLGGAIAVIGMVSMLLVTAIRHTAQLYRQEPLP